MTTQTTSPAGAPEPIAVISVAGRFPGAADVGTYWANLCAGVESISRFTPEQAIAWGQDPRLAHDPRYVGAEGVLAEGDRFDAAFFGYPPREAELMDPQHRLCLEAAWEAFDTAGYDPPTLRMPVGVYLSASLSSYLIRNLLPNAELLDQVGGLDVLTHNDKDFLPSTVSYKLGLTGPSIAVGTACSSSLVAVHLAVQALLSGECDMALAGGVSLQVPSPRGYLYRDDGVYSPDGRCRAFAANAAGTVGGSGVGVVLLKRLTDAQRDGDVIKAVILGSAVNNDGAAKSGYTAPGVDGQTAVIAEAQAVAGLRGDSIGFVETHGTGTRLGDAVEVEALTRAFRQTTTKRQFCAIGSVKASIGHLDAAAGVAGLIKAILAVEHGHIPASLHCEPENPDLRLADTPFLVNPRTIPWPGDQPRHAGVSAFGIGGTNAHVVLGQAPAATASPAGRSARRWQPLLLSAQDHEALATSRERLAAHVQTAVDTAPSADTPSSAIRGPALPTVAGLAATLAGRRAHGRRLAILAEDGDITTAMELLGARPPSSSAQVFEATAVPARPVVFVFPGLGVDLGAMAVLAGSEPAFARHLEACATALRPAGIDLPSLLRKPDANTDPAIAQPALFAMEYALARTLQEWQVQPSAVLGHGLGEYVAATLAGVFDLAGAARLVAQRGRMLAGPPPGAMLRDPMLASFRSEVRAACRRPIQDLSVISGLLGRRVELDELTDPEYWVQHLRAPVRLDAALGEALTIDSLVLLEIGPSATLTGPVQRHAAFRSGHLSFGTLPGSGVDDRTASAALAATAARLWTSGVTVDWAAYQQGSRARRVPVPLYALRRTRFWVEAPTDVRRRQANVSQVAPGVPDLASLVDAVRDTATARPNLGNARASEDAALDHLCAALSLSYLRRCGIDTAPGAHHRVSDIVDTLGVLPGYRRMIGFLLAILAEDGFLTAGSDSVTFLEREEDPDPDALTERLLAAFPARRGLVELLRHCEASYAEALSTPGAALAVLYPDGSGDLLDRTLGGGQQEPDDLDRMTEALTQLAERFAHGLGRPLRVLEVGAGGGRLTWQLATALSGLADYHATDIGPLFVDHLRIDADRRGVPIRTGRLDITRDPVGQGYRPRAYDLVVGLDVVHATPDVRETLKLLSTLLAPGGILGLVETTAKHRWLSLIWGLSDGWWSFTDDLRHRTPLLDHDGWVEALESLRGYGTAVLHATDAALLLAQSQANAADPPPAPLDDALPGTSTTAGPSTTAGLPATVSLSATAGPSTTASLSATAGLPVELPAKQADLADWSYVPSWRSAPTLPAATPDSWPERCLVFVAGPTGEQIATMLRAHARAVRIVRPLGPDAPSGTSDTVDIDPSDNDALGQTIVDTQPDLVVHAWLVDQPAGDAHTDIDRDQRYGLRHLLDLARAVGTHRAGAACRLAVITRGAHDVLGGDLTRPGQSTSLAAVKIIPREMPTVGCLGIDLPHQGDLETYRFHIVADILNPTPPPLLAYRAGRRWLPGYEPAPLPAPIGPVDGLRPGGVYLITGGLGGVGLGLAEYLATLPATVVLTRRSPFPPREQWPEKLAQDGDDPTTALIRRLVAMQAAGGHVEIHQVDVADRAGMSALVRRTVERHGPITGVIHAAGTPDLGGMIQRRSPEDTDRATAAKLAGTVVLADALADALAGQHPAFVLLCSSIGTVLYHMKFGEVGYVAGHEFLNAFAAHRNEDHRHPPSVIAIAWTDWLEAGMWAQAQQRLAGRYATGDGGSLRPDSDLLRGITTAEGIEIFRRVLAHRPGPNVIVSTQRMDQLLAAHAAYTPAAHRALLDHLAPAEDGRERPRLAVAYAPVRSTTEHQVAGVWTELLGFDHVGIDDDFFDLGGDSLVALRMLARIRELLGLTQTVVAFFQAPTIRALAADVDTQRLSAPIPTDIAGDEEVLI